MPNILNELVAQVLGLNDLGNLLRGCLKFRIISTIRYIITYSKFVSIFSKTQVEKKELLSGAMKVLLQQVLLQLLLFFPFCQ
jgi:flagellar biosynthesis protein FlhB